MRVHARTILGPDVVDEHEGVPVTSVTLVLVDLAARVSRRHLEAAVNMADSLDLLDAERLRTTLERFPNVNGVAPLRWLLDREAFRLTDSELERMFRRLVAEVGLPPPQTQRHIDGFRVDFVWHDVGLVVETDSLRYHRTAHLPASRRGPRPRAPLRRPGVGAVHALPGGVREAARAAGPRKAWRKALALRQSVT